MPKPRTRSCSGRCTFIRRSASCCRLSWAISNRLVEPIVRRSRHARGPPNPLIRRSAYQIALYWTNCYLYVFIATKRCASNWFNDWRTGQGPLFPRGPRGPNSWISAEKNLMAADNFLQKQQKQRRRPFEKGRSGNPAGRPRGSRNRSTLAAQLLLQGEAEALTRKAVELALGGDPTALRLCLDRLIAPHRERLVPFGAAADAQAGGSRGRNGGDRRSGGARHDRA